MKNKKKKSKHDNIIKVYELYEIDPGGVGYKLEVIGYYISELKARCVAGKLGLSNRFAVDPKLAIKSKSGKFFLLNGCNDITIEDMDTKYFSSVKEKALAKLSYDEKVSLGLA